MQIHGKEYAEVKDRIKAFRELFSDWNITTELVTPVEVIDKRVCFKAVLQSQSGGQTFTGYAYEERSESSKEVNFTSWVENCETSAIGRALANMGITLGESRPSAEEMQKVERMGGMAVKPETPVATGAEPKYLRPKTLGSPVKLDGVKPSTMTMLYARSNSLREIVGHDKYLMQALANRKVETIDKIQTETTAQELLDSLTDLLDFVQSEVTKVAGKVVPLRELPENDAVIISTKLDKMAMLL